ncbi:unnamed protein product [Bursaphelenchus xylophilus]|uniref:(pine wood nematode) hypothetical protein n=1 Tax=Bursaphelenchus xylophilus TaxID=6326 RepID=A0A1I7ST07_BURXY|nr:unnamed protein product [Bursaphelenchus xylophilus]CAG9108814.1 unnamed protein product [Bursaphelenchus xylophilus]
MTGEMTYILEYRLATQKVPQSRRRQVLGLILETVFREKFLEKMFYPQEIYSKSTVRQFFDKMAQISAMHLDNTSSMNRLFDMMTMVVKHQMMSIDEPKQIIDVTVNHLEGIKEILGHHPEISPQIEFAQTTFINSFSDIETWEMALIRYALLNYFQDSHMKMGEMLRAGVQLENGRFVLLGKEIRIPLDASPPGSVKYYERGQVSKITTLVMPEKYICLRKEDIQPGKTTTTLGESIYIASEYTNEEKAEETYNRTTNRDDEMKLLTKIINRSDNTGEDFVLKLFDNEDDDKHIRGRITSKADEKDRPKSRSTSKPTRYKSLAEAIGEMDLTKPSAERPSRGEHMLKMMDESESRTRSRSGPRKKTATRDLN